MSKSFIRRPKAAKILGVSVRTLLRWHKSGRLKAVKLSPRVVGYHSDALKRFMRGKPIPTEESTP